MSIKQQTALATDSPPTFIELVMGPDKGRVISLAGNKLSIGRADDNDIVVPSDAVSRTHAFLMQSDGAWYIRDNNSKNGIQVNGAKVNEAWLTPGDIVQVGNFVFRFRDLNNEGADAPAAAEPSAAYAGAPVPMDMGGEVTGMTPVKKKPNRRVLIYGTLVLLGALVWYSQNNGGSTTDDKKPAAEGQAAAQDQDISRVKESLGEVEKGLAELTAQTQKGVKLDDAQLAEVERLKTQRLKLQLEIRQLAQKMEPSLKNPDEEYGDVTALRKRIAELEAIDLSKRPPGDEEADRVTTELRKLKRQLEVAYGLPTFKESGGKTGVPALEDPTLKEAEVEMQKLDWTNSALREAEQFFRKGQREFLAGNYTRAIDSFSTALSFYRGHRLAEKYLRLSLFEVETEAKKHMEMGVQYFDSLQYQRAIYHFTEVMALMAHRPQEPIAVEAEKYITISKRRLQAAELFP